MSTVAEKNKKIMLITVFAVIVLVLLIAAMITNLVRVASLRAREKALLAQIEEMDKLIEQNKENIDYQKTDEFVDAYAREYLGMIGEGEISFIAK